MPRRKWRSLGRREPLSPALREFFETGDEFAPRAVAAGLSSKWGVVFDVQPATRAHLLWEAYRDEILTPWIVATPGTRPWAWWRWTASEPRQVIRGRELLLPVTNPGDWEFIWRKGYGVPGFRQVKPRGARLPHVESQAAYLSRLTLLGPRELAALGPEAFEPATVDPFVLDAEELDQLIGPRPQRPTAIVQSNGAITQTNGTTPHRSTGRRMP